MWLFTPDVTRWLATHHGVAHRLDLERLGATRHQLAHAARLGAIVREGTSVYRLAAAPATAEQRMALACAAGPDVVVSHRSAGRVWGLRRLGQDDRLHVTIRARSNRQVRGVVIHRSHRIEAVDVVERADGIRLTSAPRTAFDLAAVLHDDALASILEQLLHDERCTVPTLFATGRRLGEHGRSGSARFTRVLQSRPALLKPAASDLELKLERALVEAGLPRPLRQQALRLPSGEVVHPDFYWPAQREAVEVDHVTWHGGKLDLTYDKRRDRQLWQLGIHVTRVTDDEIRRHLGRAVADIATILRSRAA